LEGRTAYEVLFTTSSLKTVYQQTLKSFMATDVVFMQELGTEEKGERGKR